MKSNKHAEPAGAGPLAAALGVAALLAAAPAPATAMQILAAADHAELTAEVSGRAVSRIALMDDRIARVIRAPDGFAVEHDPARGDLYLRPPGAGGADGMKTMRDRPVTLFLGTEKGFTYRLTLAVRDRGSAQILIRDPAARTAETGAVPASDARIGALAALVRAVARREPPPGTVIATGGGAPGGGDGTIETWRGPRFTARVLEVDEDRFRRRRRTRRGRGPGRCRRVALRPGHRPLGRADRGGDPPERDPRGSAAMSAEDRATRKNRRNQLVLFSGLAAVLLVGFAAWIGAGGGNAPSPGPAIDAELAGPGTAEETWIRRSESRMGSIESRLREMEGDNRRLAADNEKLRTPAPLRRRGRALGDRPPGRDHRGDDATRRGGQSRAPPRKHPRREPRCRRAASSRRPPRRRPPPVPARTRSRRSRRCG